MKIEVKQLSAVPKGVRRSSYDVVVSPVRQLRESEALYLEPDDGVKLVSCREGVRQALKKAGITNVMLSMDPSGKGMWLVRKAGAVAASQAPAPPVRAVEAVRPAAPLGAALAAGGA